MVKVKKGFCQEEVKTIKPSLPLDFGTSDFTLLSELIIVLSTAPGIHNQNKEFLDGLVIIFPTKLKGPLKKTFVCSLCRVGAQMLHRQTRVI